jgi:hypothetical protein
MPTNWLPQRTRIVKETETTPPQDERENDEHAIEILGSSPSSGTGNHFVVVFTVEVFLDDALHSLERRVERFHHGLSQRSERWRVTL